MVKVPKGTVKSHERHNVKRWVLIVAGGVDGLIVLLLVGVWIEDDVLSGCVEVGGLISSFGSVCECCDSSCSSSGNEDCSG